MDLFKNLKKLIKRIPLVYGLFRSIRFLKQQIYMSHPKMLKKEISLFLKILPQLEVIFDVGARYDIDYIENSTGRGIEFHLFEINPKFFRLLEKKAAKYPNEKIYLNNVGIGHKEEEKLYYLNSESVLDSLSNKFESFFTNKLKITTLKKYVEERSISQINLLKTDIESFDYFALLGLGNYLLNINFVQFELGIGAPLGNRYVEGEDYLKLFKDQFNFFLVSDEINPIFYSLPDNIDLISFDIKNLKHIRKIQRSGIGFNILAIKKSCDLSKLNLLTSKYDEALFDIELRKIS